MIEPLMFYDTSSSQWISCLATYPHDVTKDGYLLLRRPSVMSLSLWDDYLELATARPIHFRHNLTGEREYVRQQHRERKKHLSTITLRDIEEEEQHRHKRKKLAEQIIDLCDEETLERIQLSVTPTKRAAKDDITPDRPSQRRRCDTPFSISTSHSSPVKSPSPSPMTNDIDIMVPESSKPWPHGMYTIDMKNSFRLVSSEEFKHLNLEDRLRKVFGKKIPPRTFQDQKKFWSLATEHHRQSFVDAGRTNAGLWLAFRKH